MVLNKEKLIQKTDVRGVSLDDIIFNEREGNLRLVVKTHHVVADQFKTKLLDRPGIEPPWDSVLTISRENFIDFYEQVYEWASKLEEKELDNLVYNPYLADKGPDMSRLWRYNNAKWSIETIPLAEIGVWPRYFGVDHSLTTGNVVETAKGIEEYLESNKGDSMVPQKAIDKARSMVEYADLLFQLFPLIILESGENTRRVIENRNPEVTQLDLFRTKEKYIITPYDTEDGAGRAVAFALSGVKEVRCLVGGGLQETYTTKGVEARMLKSLSNTTCIS